MPFKKSMKGLSSEPLPAEGLLNQDWDSLTPCQRSCMNRLGITIQMEHEAYLSQHPEVIAILKMFVSKMAESGKRKGVLQAAAKYFTQPTEKLDRDIKEYLKLQFHESYKDDKKPTYNHSDDFTLEQDIKSLIMKYYPPDTWKVPTPEISTPNTVSSSFLSIITSDTTLPTPEPIPTPEPTLYENFYSLISNTVDKAIYLHVDDMTLRYDTAYVELQKAVENAMEVPVIEIREEIAALFYNAYKMFELDILEKERIAAEIAWEKRMRKKLKRTLRRVHNFKGYESPPTPKSEISSNEEYLKPPQKPCKCHPQFNYNRYQKDRFGIYLPREEVFSNKNITATPAISTEHLTAENEGDSKTPK